MDGSRFDALSRSLAPGHSRRALTRVLSGLTFSGTLARCGVTETAAKGKHHQRHGQAQGKKKKPCPPCKKRQEGQVQGPAAGWVRLCRGDLSGWQLSPHRLAARLHPELRRAHLRH